MNEARGVTLPDLGSFSAEERATAARRICFSGEEAAIEIAKNDPARFVTISIDCQQELFRRESQLTASLEREAELEAEVERLRGKPFSDRMYAALESRLAAAQNAALVRENEQSAMDAATVEERFELRERLRVCERALEAMTKNRDQWERNASAENKRAGNALVELRAARAELAKEKANG
jgi:hypothetical protein